MKIHSNDDLEIANLSEDEKNIVLNHALMSAEILDQIPSVPFGISALVREHHGAKLGVGFPNQLNLNVSPIAMMFLVVEHFVSEFLKYDKSPAREDLESIFEKMELLFSKSTFAQTLLALQKIILR